MMHTKPLLLYKWCKMRKAALHRASWHSVEASAADKEGAGAKGPGEDEEMHGGREDADGRDAEIPKVLNTALSSSNLMSTTR